MGSREAGRRADSEPNQVTSDSKKRRPPRRGRSQVGRPAGFCRARCQPCTGANEPAAKGHLSDEQAGTGTPAAAGDDSTLAEQPATAASRAPSGRASS